MMSEAERADDPVNHLPAERPDVPQRPLLRSQTRPLHPAVRQPVLEPVAHPRSPWDPTLPGVGTNRYAYAGNDPINKSDPSGHEGPSPSSMDFAIDRALHADWDYSTKTRDEFSKTSKTIASGALNLADLTPSGRGFNLGRKAAVAAARRFGPRVKNFLGRLFSRARRKCSFAPQTWVLTDDGLKRIDSLKPGQRVVARQEKTGKQGLKKILTTGKGAHNLRILVTVRSAAGQTETITVSREHPFWVAGRGWVAAEQLAPGDALSTADMTGATVTSVTARPKPLTAWNLEVSGYHSFFVGRTGLWVHNGPCGKNPIAQANRKRNIEKGIPPSALGPSGKPKIHKPLNPSRKRAIDKARRKTAKNRAPVVHSNPTVGPSHAHSVNSQGKTGRVHHGFPSKGFPGNSKY